MDNRSERFLTWAVGLLVVVAVAVAGFAHWVKQKRAAVAHATGTEITRPLPPQGQESVSGPGGVAPPSGVPVAMAPPQGPPPSGAPVGPPPSGGPAPVGAPQAQPIPEGEPAGPYLPWPESFPKLLPGLFMLEQDAPNLRLTDEQVAQMLPIVDEMGRNWKIVHDVEIKIKQNLSLEQRAWITRVKHSVETSETTFKVMQEMGTMAPGENASVTFLIKTCRERAPKPVPAALARKAEAERGRVLTNAEYTQKPGEEWLTVFDETNAFYEIEKSQPDLRVTPEQAVIFLAIIQEVVEPLRVVSMNEARLRAILTEDQKKYVRDNMAELYKFRTGMRNPEGGTLAFPNHKANTDAEKYHDPLYYETVRFLKGRLGQT